MRRRLLREGYGWGSLLLRLLTIGLFLWFVRVLVHVALERFARAIEAALAMQHIGIRPNGMDTR